MSETVSLKITPEMSWDEIEAGMSRMAEAIRSAKRELADMHKTARDMAQALATETNYTGPITNFNRTEQQRFVRHLNRTTFGSDDFAAMPDEVKATIRRNTPQFAAFQDHHEQMQAREQQLQTFAAQDRANRTIAASRKYDLDSVMVIQRRAQDRSRIYNLGAQQAQEEYYQTGYGRSEFDAGQANLELRSQRRNMARRVARSGARSQAAAEYGVTLPEATELSPFAKLLQNTFKSATSLGMLEALSGGTAAPLARALGNVVIGGMLLPAATNSLSSLFRSTAATAAGQVAGQSVTSLVGQDAGSAAGTAAGDAAGSAGADVGSVLEKGAAGSGIGAAAGSAIPGVGTLAGGLIGFGAAALLAAGLTGGLALYGSSQVAQKNQMEQQLMGATSGAMANNPGGLIDQTANLSRKYWYDTKTSAGVLTGVGQQGISSDNNQQLLQAENAMILARLMNVSDPTKMVPLIGSLANQGGMNADAVTKLIELISVQNDLSKDHQVSFDTMVSNLQQLVQSNGGQPINANEVAGMTALVHAFAGQGPQGKAAAQQIGSVMGGLTGATGFTAVALEGLLGLPEGAIAGYQAKPSGAGALGIFNSLSKFVRSSTANISNPKARLEQAEGILQSMSAFGLNMGNLGAGGTSAFTQMMLSGNWQSSANKYLQQLMGFSLANPNTFRSTMSGVAGDQTSVATKTMIDLQSGQLQLVKNMSTNLPTYFQNVITAIQLAAAAMGPNSPANPIPGGNPTPIPGRGTTPLIRGKNQVTGGYVTGWNLGTSTPSIIPGQYGAMVNQAAAALGIDPNVVASIMGIESGGATKNPKTGKTQGPFDPTTLSSAGAMGLMQLMPGTYKDLMAEARARHLSVPGSGAITDPATNIFLGSLYLQDIMRKVGPLTGNAQQISQKYAQIGEMYNAGINATSFSPQAVQEGTKLASLLSNEQLEIVGTLKLADPNGAGIGTATIQARKAKGSR